MATIITDLKETFRRGNIYIQLIYINVAVFILTTLTEVMFQLFNRSIAGVFSPTLHPATMVTTDIYVHACRIHAHSFQYAVALLVRCTVPEFLLCKASPGCIHSGRNLRRSALYGRL